MTGLHGGPDEVVTMAAGLVAAMAGAWLLGLALLIGLAAVPGLPGRCGRAAALRLSPALLRGLVVALLGAGGLSGVAQAEEAGRGPLDWPTGGAPGAPISAGMTPKTPPASPIPQAAVGEAVVVSAGDSLWRIASRAATGVQPPSDAEIARAWPRWHRTNRAVIGANPHLIHPGQQLRPPTVEETR